MAPGPGVLPLRTKRYYGLYSSSLVYLRHRQGNAGGGRLSHLAKRRGSVPAFGWSAEGLAPEDHRGVGPNRWNAMPRTFRLPASLLGPSRTTIPLRILFFSPKKEDYLAATLLYGLRHLPEVEVVDHPRYDCMYQDYPRAKLGLLHGRGFTLFGGLPDPWGRTERPRDLSPRNLSCFDLVVFSCLWDQADLFLRWERYLSPDHTGLVDGADDPAVPPFAGRWFREPGTWLRLRKLSRFRIWKREWTGQSQRNLWHRLLPKFYWSYLPPSPRLYPISFGIPQTKIISQPTKKTTNFPAHIVDPEVRCAIGAGSKGHVFRSEAEYYRNLQGSRFGITMKRSGWDCLRHYEIAANGAVPCFRDLDRKPPRCAPHGLSSVNSISYRTAGELLEKVSSLSETEYGLLQQGALLWVQAQSAQRVAKRFLGQAFGQSGKTCGRQNP